MTIKENDFITFKHKVFGEVPIITQEGRQYFGATEVAKALGYSNPQKAVRDHCKEAGCTNRSVRYSSGTKKKKFINEGNLYRLIVKSRLPQAEEFETWVFDELIPQIREEGMYIGDHATDEDKKFNFKLLSNTFDLCDVGRLEELYEECMTYYSNKRIPFLKKVKGKRSDSKHSLADSKIMVMDKIRSTLLERKMIHEKKGKYAHVHLISSIIEKCSSGILTIRHKKTIGKYGARTKELESIKEYNIKKEV
ncbi:BRO-N domain-containing protein [Bacillus inaquosorum]|uniref:BRO-N domain-containing protein n=1 Tax=Bacillus inaquosorum TaxID=483913 RepID=UPI002DBEE9A1|nr:BRO family protein [Bacillus inaquosorum]MEC2062665.1 BRO family protein [Bacillus inaquosorum]MEC2086192.1 BRO family protein [Bacillus inaquosorum]